MKRVIVTALTLLALVFAVLSLTTSHGVTFGILAILTGGAGLVLNRLIWREGQ